MLVINRTLYVEGNITLSTITSFKDGEAHILAADELFIQIGYISSELFYTRLVSVASSLPGLILVKIASGIAYCMGFAFCTFSITIKKR